MNPGNLPQHSDVPSYLHLRCSDKAVNVKDCKAALLVNRLGGDGISGPGAVPQGGANPGRRRHPIFLRPVMDATP